MKVIIKSGGLHPVKAGIAAVQYVAPRRNNAATPVEISAADPAYASFGPWLHGISLLLTLRFRPCKYL
ncbi:MAG: hypothetical protein AAFX04_03725 [Pseudomonadota bacterium]